MRGLLSGLGGRACGSFALVFCLALSLAPARAAEIAGEPKNGPEGGKGFVPFTLTVMDVESGHPVSGAKVFSTYFVRAQPGLNLEPQQWTTDGDGKITLRLPEGPLQHFAVSVTHSNYAPRQLIMQGDGTRIQTPPSQYMLNLSKGVTLGGFVRNEKGEAVAGLKIILWGYGGTAPQPSGRSQLMEMAAVERNETNAVVSDSKGFWVWPNVPIELNELFVEVARPGGAVSRFGTENQQRLSFDNATQVSLAALKATNAVLTLKDGVTVRGVVVDSSGKPVPQVRLRERSVRSGHPFGYSFTNQADGRFELKNRDSVEFFLTAEAEGFAITSTVVTPGTGTKEVRLELPPATPMRLRVLGENNQPVADAEVRPVEWRMRQHALDWKGKTDTDGRVVWTNAPRGELSYYIASLKYPMRAVRVMADNAEHSVTLEKDSDKKITIRIKATDAENGEPIAKFEVQKGQEWGDRFEKWDDSGKNGLLQKDLVQGDVRSGFVSSYRLQVRAEGYRPWTSDTMFFEEGSQELAVKLAKGRPLVGIIVQPNGQLAENAQVILNTSRNSLYLNNSGEVYLQPGMTRERTTADGKFRFEPAEPEGRLIVIHPAGFASLTVQELPPAGELRLQPWGRVEGVLQVLGKPKANEQISIRYPLSWSTPAEFNLHYSARTDAQGRFVFTNLPPGHFVLYRQPRSVMGPITESHRVPVEVKAGEVKQLSYGFNGRTVVGHVDAEAAVDWNNDAHILVAKVPEPPPPPSYYVYGNQKDYEKARKEYAQSPQVIEYERKRNQFQLIFNKDGDFRLEDVPPGQYELTLRATKPPEDKNMRFRGGPNSEKVIGTLTRQVTIPAGKEEDEFDLGSFELEVKEPALAASSPLSLQAVTLDGQAFDLASLRGRPVVLVFWANYASKSKTQLELARAAQSQVKGATFVTVNLDEEPAVAAAGVKNLTGTDWVHLRLAGTPRVSVTEELSVDSLPMTFVLDAQGRPAARDVEGKRLRSALQRVAAKTAKK